MKLKYAILALLIILFGYLLKTDSVCTNFNGNFHYSSAVNSFHLKELISTETNTPIPVVRLFHNKITVFMFDIFARFIEFFNIFYLTNILSLAGLFGFLNFYFLLFARKIKNKSVEVFGIAILLFPFLEIFQVLKPAFPLKLLFLVLPYQIASFMGSVWFLEHKKSLRFLIYILLLVLSVGWIIVFQNEALSFCTTG